MTYDLVVTSELFTSASLAQCQKLQTQKEKEETKSTNIVSQYINRPDSLDHISLEEYFYNHFCDDTFDDTKKNRILMANGLNFKPRYPVDFNYARGIILLHKPWGPNNPSLKPIFQDKELTVRTFHTMIANKEVPTSVVTQYNLAVKYSQQAKIELLAKQGMTDDNPNFNEMDEDEQQLYLESEAYGSMIDNKTQIRNRLGNKEVNIGIGHDWTVRTVNPYVDVDGRNYLNKLSDDFYKSMNEPVTSPEMLRLPRRQDGEKYNVIECTQEQATIVLAAVDTVIKFITNDREYKPLRATVVGEAGTGKSYVINTLTTIVRNLTQCNDTVIVGAPSGASAYNVGGCTLHRSLMIAVDEKISKLSKDKKKELQYQLKRVLVFIIDERSMVGSKLLANSESHLRQCAFNGNNTSEYWGGVPVVILFGDDYQLPPVVQEGAIMGFAKSKGNTKTDTSRMRKSDQLSANYGSKLFIEDLVDNVFILSVNKRVKGGHEQYKNLLRRLRVGKPSEKDADKLCNLHLNEYPAEFESELESKGKVMYLCATHKVKNEINERKLTELSDKAKVPIAAFLDCHFTSEYNGKMKDDSAIRRSHFFHNKYVREVKYTHLCVGARVAIDTVNFIPELGLYNGAIGTVIDIVYNTREGPNGRKGSHLPEYVIVDFPSFNIDNAPNLKPWDANNPTHVPIPMKTQPCQYNCCRVTFCPLVPAWASTIHKFQGMQAGQDDDDIINFLIIDCGDMKTEHNCPGMCYVSTSRAKTIGNNFDDKHPKDSSLYWIGVGMYQQRLKDGAMKWDDKKTGQKVHCKKVQDRDEWVAYLNKKAEKTKQVYNCDKMQSILNTTFKVALSNSETDRYDANRVDTSIMNMLHNPNEEWKKVKKDSKYTVPRSFYD